MRSIKELHEELHRVNTQIFKMRKQVVYIEIAKRRKNHTVNRLIEARLVCFESADADGLLEIASSELDILEDLLDIEQI